MWRHLRKHSMRAIVVAIGAAIARSSHTEDSLQYAVAHSPQAHHTVLDVFQASSPPSVISFDQSDIDNPTERCSRSSSFTRNRCHPHSSKNDDSSKLLLTPDLEEPRSMLSILSESPLPVAPSLMTAKLPTEEKKEDSPSHTISPSSSPSSMNTSSSIASPRRMENPSEKCRSFSSSSSSFQRTLSPGVHTASSPCFSTKSALPPMTASPSEAVSSSSFVSYGGSTPTTAIAKEEGEQDGKTGDDNVASSVSSSSSSKLFDHPSATQLIREDPAKAFEREALKEGIRTLENAHVETISSSSRGSPMTFLEALGHASAAEAAALGGGAWDLSLWGLGAFQKSLPSVFPHSDGKNVPSSTSLADGTTHTEETEGEQLRRSHEGDTFKKKMTGGGEAVDEKTVEHEGETKNSLLEVKAKVLHTGEEGELTRGDTTSKEPISSSWYSVFKSKVQSVFDKIDRKVAESNGMLMHGDLYEFPL
ncbi:hypothetical protein CSUI_004760 [Cystoisospora suis]|uniref:Uncharacterized protein n=1 Tax=Cystoisospora suis TaxID=483139 RepID=A0A2C6L0B6_9APIC|nr:hypothetical protein CSUI_004760 [Cystoisospora suis]